MLHQPRHQSNNTPYEENYQTTALGFCVVYPAIGLLWNQAFLTSYSVFQQLHRR
jgi:hypothetical protein